MAVLSKDEARRERAKKHAKRRHTCSLCGKVTHGNGGRSSHRNAHLRKAGLVRTFDAWLFLLSNRQIFYDTERSTA